MNRKRTNEEYELVDIRVTPIDAEIIVNALRLYGHVNDIDLNDLMNLVEDQAEGMKL